MTDNDQQSLDERALYPDDSRFDRFTPAEWVVREVKHDRHVVFEYDGEAGSRLCHVEADGMSPVVSLHDGTDIPFYRGAGDGFTTFDGALAFAGTVMRAFELGVQAIQSGDGGDGDGGTVTFEATDSEHARTVTLPEDRSDLSFGGPGEDILDVMDRQEQAAHQRGAHDDRHVETCPECADSNDSNDGDHSGEPTDR